MKAHINGITVEGTPEEIWQFIQRHNAQGTHLKPYQDMPDWNGPWQGLFPPYGNGTAKPYYPPDTMIICMNMTESE